MIEYQNKYEEFIIENGVGANDVVADSVKSYISYLNSVSNHLEITVSPLTLSSENDIQNLAAQLEGKVSAKTIKNYRSAMAQYINMISALNLKTN